MMGMSNLVLSEDISLSPVLIKALEAVVIVIAGFIVSRAVQKIVTGFMVRAGRASGGIFVGKRAETLQSAGISLVKYIVYFFVVYFLTGVFTGDGVNPLLAVAGAVGVAIGLGAQNFIKDIISGFFIIFEDLYAIGDTVDIQGIAGAVEKVGLRTTKLRGYLGQLYTIPNGSIQTVANLSRDYAVAAVDVMLPYSEDIDKVMDILADEMKKSAEHISDITEAPSVAGIVAWSDFNLTVRISAVCLPGKSKTVEAELRLRIKRRFQSEGIRPPSSEITIGTVN